MKSHLTLARKVIVWKCVETMQRNTENQRNVLSHFWPKVQIDHFDTTPMIYILLRIIFPISVLEKMLEVFGIPVFMKPFPDETWLRMKSLALPDVSLVVHRHFGGTYCPPSFSSACGCFIIVTSLYYSLIPRMETVQCSEMVSTGLHGVMLWEPETHPDFFIVTCCQVFIAITFKAVWKEEVMAELRYYPSICPDRQWKTTTNLRTLHILSEIRLENGIKMNLK